MSHPSKLAFLTQGCRFVLQQPKKKNKKNTFVLLFLSVCSTKQTTHDVCLCFFFHCLTITDEPFTILPAQQPQRTRQAILPLLLHTHDTAIRPRYQCHHATLHEQPFLFSCVCVSVCQVVNICCRLPLFQSLSLERIESSLFVVTLLLECFPRGLFPVIILPLVFERIVAQVLLDILYSG